MANEFDHLLEPPSGRSFINDQRRLQFIASATRLIAERGVEGASFSVIAEDTGSSKGTIAYHFESRNQLLLAVVRAIYLSAGESMTDALHAPVPADAVQNYIRTAVSWIAAHPREVVALVALRTGSDAEVRAFCNQIDQAVLEQLANLIKTTQPSRSAGTDPLLVALALRGSIDAFSLALLRNPDLEAHEYYETLVDIFVAGVRA